MNDYKNYELQVLEANRIIERNQICLYSAAIYRNASIYAYDKINDPVDGSDNIIIDVNAEVLETLAKTYHDEIYSKATNKQIYEYGRKYGLKTLIGINSDVEESNDNHYVVTNLRKYMDLDATNFDPIVGTNKLLNPRVTKVYKNNGSVSAFGLEIEPVEVDENGAAKNVSLTATYGNNLVGGSDGAFALKTNGGTAEDQESIDASIDAAYAAAYDPQNITITTTESLEEGSEMAVDERIYSTTRFPLNVILDAGFPMLLLLIWPRLVRIAFLFSISALIWIRRTMFWSMVFRFCSTLAALILGVLTLSAIGARFTILRIRRSFLSLPLISCRLSCLPIGMPMVISMFLSQVPLMAL